MTKSSTTPQTKRPNGPLRTAEEKKARKQQRAKARRNVHRATEALELLYKPLEEWDEEELARGQARDIRGRFNNTPPPWISRAVHEEAIRRFTDLTQSNMRAIIPKALRTVEYILDHEGEDEKGRPIVPYGVKLDAAKWVVEHLVGKPTQRVESEISVRLQGMLANVIVQPDGDGGMRPAIDAAWSEEESDADFGAGGGGD